MFTYNYDIGYIEWYPMRRPDVSNSLWAICGPGVAQKYSVVSDEIWLECYK